LSLSSVFPDRWKESYVVPIFKNGSRSDVECYRGVAILPTFGKLFESIVCNILTDKFKDVISISQHGFMKGRSTSTNLVDFVNEAIRVVEKGNQLDVIYTDVRKAFDRVTYDLCALDVWCLANSLELNVKKCVMMSFVRKHDPVRFEYKIGESTLERVTEMRDLGVTFMENLSFNRHMDLIIAKAYSMLGFVNRMCKDFRASTSPIAPRICLRCLVTVLPEL